MQQIKKDLQALCAAEGVGGQTNVTDVAMNLLRPLVDEVEVDVMGNVLGLRRAADANAPTLMLEAHLDEIGFLVTHIDDGGFVYTAAAGGIDKRAITAQPVIVFGDKPYYGVFCSTPPHLSKDGELLPVEKCGIDIGLSGEEAKKAIPLGSRVSYAPRFVELNENVVSAKALDDRAGIAAILHCLRKIEGKPAINIAVAFCVQEELGCRGVTPATRKLNPDYAIVTDVSFALTPDADPRKCGKLGKGVMIGISPILSTSMTDRLLAIAKDKEIPYQYEVMGGSTGTDADRVTVSLMGVPTALLSIPQRYMHTPIETIDVRDVATVGDLMAAYIDEGGAVNE